MDGFHLTEEQASKNLAMSLCYTILELLGDTNAWNDCFEVPKLRAYFNIYGCLAKDESEIYRACFDVYIYIHIKQRLRQL